MKKLTIADVVRVTGGVLIGGDEHLGDVITGVVRDNREVQAGYMFVCIEGARSDGHNYASAAFSSGASCCLCQHELDEPAGPYILVNSTLKALRDIAIYYRSLFTIPVIGVVGSVGKTTAKEMLASVLSARFNTYKTPKNLNNEIGVPLSLLQLEEEHEMAVIEMGISGFGEMSVLAEMVRPDVCVVTSIGYCHLENLGDLNGVLKAKAEVFGFMPENGVAVVNGDDEMLRSYDPGIRKLTFGYGEHNDYRADKSANMGAGGVLCEICGDDLNLSVHIPAFGSHITLAALPAAAVGRLYGMTEGEIAAGLTAYKTIEGRANVIDTGYIRVIDDCYNANPHSMTAALLSLVALPGRHVAILGDMKELGRDSVKLHREVGAFAGSCGVDALICCGDQANSIYKGLIASGSEIEAWQFPMKDALLSVLPSLIRQGDNVLVKASHSMNFDEITEELKKLS